MTDPALFFTAGGGFGAWTDSHQVLIVQYASDQAGMQLLSVGDSITVGEASGSYPPGTGPVHWAADALHSAALPCEVANCGVGSSNNANFIKIAAKMLPLVRPTHAVLSPFSPNLTLNAANVALMHGKTGRALDLCMQYRAVPVLWTGLPSTPIGTEGSTQGKTWTAGEDALRIGINNVYKAGAWPCADYATAAYGGLMGSGQIKLLQAFSQDGLHTNNAGNRAFGALLANAILSVQ